MSDIKLMNVLGVLVIALVFSVSVPAVFAGEPGVEERPVVIIERSAPAPVQPQQVTPRGEKVLRQREEPARRQSPSWIEKPRTRPSRTRLPLAEHGLSREQLDAQECGCCRFDCDICFLELQCRKDKLCDSARGVVDDLICFPAMVIGDRISEVARSEEWLDEQRSDFGCLSPCNPCSWVCGTATLGGKVVKGVVGAAGFTLQQGGKAVVHGLDAVSVFTPAPCEFRLAAMCEGPVAVAE